MDKLRTLLARFTVAYFTRSTLFVVRSWFWLASETQDIQEKRGCLNALLDPDTDNEPASLALLLFDQSRPESWVPSLAIANSPRSLLYCQ